MTEEVDYTPKKMGLREYIRRTRSEQTKRGMKIFNKGGRPKKEKLT